MRWANPKLAYGLMGAALMLLPPLTAQGQSVSPTPPVPSSTAWQWSSLPNGTHLISSTMDPDAASELFAFFNKQGEQIWGVRFVAQPGTVPTCFQGKVLGENLANEALSVLEPHQQEWYFNMAPLDFTGLPHLLSTLPSDWTVDQVVEQIVKCRTRLASIESVIELEAERKLLLGVLSYLPLEQNKILQDGSFYNDYRFSGQAGQRVRIEMKSNAFDTYVILLDADGNTIATDDDSGGAQNAQLDVVLPHTGQYQVIANTYDFLSEGEYTLTVTTD
ncbi:PPC domain-containing protein [Leptolyngbya cf. ectocarpi LEGE 11479]|uniref:PPC domain-containing protein n=1 Tax=Leptolyngbya cf. ectocarpi LEGE 11479 TaxID=1828722 RepID=A0A928ZZW2_LEPEC|nr:PPC domain-containing protein [Leptolyngbya ectocarpi]MBE9070495.1 PPC domain-containing protein [Leptolyngbya cf. ectocarpi LEGE 11479]